MKNLYLLGSEISYSLSPAIYKIIFSETGESATYSLLDVNRERFDEGVDFLLENSIGFNVTKPYKKAIAQRVTDKSGIGSINTVVCQKKEGYSTDGDGFLSDFSAKYGEVKGKNILLIGAGGGAVAVGNSLKNAGAKVSIYNRTRQHTLEICAKFGFSVYDGCKVDKVVSAVTNTIYPPVELKGVDVYDLRYSGETLSLGGKCVNGLGMLIGQAIYAYMHFFGCEFSFEDIERLKRKITEEICKY